MEPSKKRRLSSVKSTAKRQHFAADWSRFMSDLLRSFFLLIPHRPRLIIVSIVCRHWRAVALSTIKSVPPPLSSRLHSNLVSAFMKFFPICTQLEDLSAAYVPSIPWTYLQRLSRLHSLRLSFPLQSAVLQGVSNLPLLHVHVSIDTLPGFHEASRVGECCLTTLTSLHVSGTGLRECLGAFSPDRNPHLIELTVSNDNAPEDALWERLIAPFMSQLTAISLTDMPLSCIDLFTEDGTRYPNLTRLTVLQHEDLTGAPSAVALFAKKFSSLTAVYLPLIGRIAPNLISCLAPFIIELGPTVPLPYLPNLPKLRTYRDLYGIVFPSEDMLARLEHLRTSNHFDIINNICVATALTRLDCIDLLAQGVEIKMGNWRLPYLDTLSLLGRSPDTLVLLASYYAHFPRLRRVEFELPNDTKTTILRLSNLMERLGMHGVEEVCITVRDEAAASFLRELQKRHKWLSCIVQLKRFKDLLMDRFG